MIKFEDVATTYSGKPGCACGCNGTYAVASHYGVEAANKDCGYEAHDTVSDRSVKSTITKLNKLIDWNDPKSVEQHVDNNVAWIDNKAGTRTYTVYFVKPGYGKQVRLQAAARAMLAIGQAA